MALRHLIIDTLDTQMSGDCQEQTQGPLDTLSAALLGGSLGSLCDTFWSHHFVLIFTVLSTCLLKSVRKWLVAPGFHFEGF